MPISDNVLQRLRDNDKTFTEFSSDCSSLNPDDINVLLDALQNNTCLISLDLRHNDNRIDNIIERLAANKTLRTLMMVNCELSAANVTKLATNTTLHTLDIAYNYLCDSSAEKLAANTTLHTLNISQNNIGVEGAKKLAANTSLPNLDISYNYIKPEGIKAFLSNKTLTSLNLYRNVASHDTEANDAINKVQAHIKKMNSTIFNLNSSCNFFNHHLPNPYQANQKGYPGDVIITCENSNNFKP